PPADDAPRRLDRKPRFKSDGVRLVRLGARPYRQAQNSSHLVETRCRNPGASAQGRGKAAMIRRTLPQRRGAETFDMRFWDQQFTVTVGFYADGTPGEVFIDGCKTGNDIHAIARDGAVLVSLALQHGVTLETIHHAITRDNSGAAASILGAV